MTFSFVTNVLLSNKRWAIGVMALDRPWSQSWSGRIPDRCFHVFMGFYTGDMFAGTMRFASFESTM